MFLMMMMMMMVGMMMMMTKVMMRDGDGDDVHCDAMLTPSSSSYPSLPSIH
jgi:hypothetical protein